MTGPIPTARKKLTEIASYLEGTHRMYGTASQLREIVESMKRRKPLSVAKRSEWQPTPTITDAIKAKVFNLKSQGMSNRRIAALTGLHDGGRVSEVLHGDR